MSRRSFTIQRKLEILKQIVPGVRGFGVSATAKKNNISPQTLRGWLKSKDGIEYLRGSHEFSTVKARRLPGGGRKTPFDQLDENLISWVKLQNDQGLSIKDKYIRAKAIAVKNLLLDQEEDDALRNFSASSGNLLKYKSCFEHKIQFALLSSWISFYLLD